jgi:hypothetical protein
MCARPRWVLDWDSLPLPVGFEFGAFSPRLFLQSSQFRLFWLGLKVEEFLPPVRGQGAGCGHGTWTGFPPPGDPGTLPSSSSRCILRRDRNRPEASHEYAVATGKKSWHLGHSRNKPGELAGNTIWELLVGRSSAS